MNSVGPASGSSAGLFVKQGNIFGWLRRRHEPMGETPAMTIFQLTDRLHDGHTARVPPDEIAATVSAWLAEVGAHSPLVDDLASAVRLGDWPATYAIGDYLSIDVTVAP